jgi:hypothetical protein
MPSHDYLHLDVDRVLAVCEGRIDAAASADPFIADLLARLPPSRWTLEWFLPWWLGAAFGLDEAIAFEIVTSNVLGLGSIRVQDDVADDEVDAANLEAAARLGPILYRLALEPYRALFPPGSPFWGHLDACMATWRGAGRRLAARGAPLKISAFAVCLLADRADHYPGLDRCLDHALTGLALYDDLADWRADLAVGRWNSFVAQATGGSDPARVIVAMLTDEAVARQTDRIVSEMSAAAVIADELGITPLADTLRRLGSETKVQGAELQAHYREIAERAGHLLSGAAIEPTRL